MPPETTGWLSIAPLTPPSVQSWAPVAAFSTPKPFSVDTKTRPGVNVTGPSTVAAAGYCQSNCWAVGSKAYTMPGGESPSGSPDPVTRTLPSKAGVEMEPQPNSGESQSLASL